MAHPDYIRQKAIQMRVEKRLTIDEIAERLAISRTTVYYWVRDISVPRKGGAGFASEAQRKGTLAMQAKYRAIREQAYQQGLDEFPELSQDRRFRDFICMYIGEGYKRSRNDVSICNSDPAVMKLGNQWVTSLTSNKFDYSLQYHEDQSFDDLCAFWGEHLGIDPASIRAQRKSNSGKLSGRTWRSRHGVFSVRVGDTRLRARLQAWMDSIRAEWE